MPTAKRVSNVAHSLGKNLKRWQEPTPTLRGYEFLRRHILLCDVDLNTFRNNDEGYLDGLLEDARLDRNFTSP